MKELVIKYKSVIRFIITFLSVYILLSVAYKLYLDFSDGSKYYPDYLTSVVAKQSKELLETVGYETKIEPHADEPSMKLIIRNKYIARVVEGCNSISVIILFLSFIIAFSGKFKTTLFYLLAGSTLIYAVNLLRIVILSIGLYHYPWRQEILHTVIFPGIIYGLVFILWMFWVNRFSNLKEKMSKSSKYILLIVLFGLLALIRLFEEQLFYDPYLSFFKSDYLYIDNPRREVFKLTAFTTLRYVLNTIISLGILYVFFKDKSIVRFSALIYTLAYFILLLLFLYFVMNPKQEDYYLFFNVRRFLIQPIILLLLLPAFYYNKQRQ